MFRSWRREAAAIVAFAMASLAIGLLVDDRYHLQIFTLVAIWAVFALSWNLLGGYAGFVSFGHAACFGLGAFAIAIGEYHHAVSPWITLPGAAVLGALGGVLIGYPTFRLKGHYFALAMLAYPLALLYVFEWLGFQEVTIPMRREQPALHMQFADPYGYLAVAFVTLMVAMLASLAIERTRFGLALFAIREDAQAAEAAGIDTQRWKLLAMAVSGAMAAFAGGLYTVVLLVITPPSVFGLIVSAQALILSLFGGAGSLWGPVIGALVMVPLAEWLNATLGHALPGIQGVVLGVAIIVVMLVAPGGIYWWARERLRITAPPIVLPPAGDLAGADGGGGGGGTEPILRVRQVSRSFGGVRALQDVTFDVLPGSLLGIIGPNGAGKTTLFDVLNGYTRPDSGTVEFLGRNIVGLPTNRIAALGIARTFQVARIFPNATVTENVLAGALFKGASPSEALQRAADALAFVGLSGRGDARGSELTNKEVRLLELARALAGRPMLVLLDETLAGLGRSDIAEVVGVVRRLPSLGITVLIIEHTMHAMLQLTESLLVLDHGAVVTVGAPGDVVRNPEVVEAYLGRKWAARHA
jgi:branched-chain amino acid transport system permease protein